MTKQIFIEEKKVPAHVVIVPDGNRRWAKERGKKPWEGHEAGAKNTEKMIRFGFDRGIGCLTFWGSSLENITKRPLDERLALLDVYERYFKDLIASPDIHKKEVKISMIGRWREQFPKRLIKIIDEALEKTKGYSKRKLNFMLAYSGDDEMLDAIKAIVESGVSASKITGELLKESLWTRDLPAVDFLIRTGREPHLSAGFMMWDMANAELYFSDKYYPDFDEREFGEALLEYNERGRRKGI